MEFYELHTSLIRNKPEKHISLLPLFPGPALPKGRSGRLEKYLNDLLALPPDISQSILIKQFFTPGIGDPGQSSIETSKYSPDAVQTEELNDIRVAIPAEDRYPSDEDPLDQGLATDIFKPLEAQADTNTASAKESKKLQHDLLDSLCETFVTVIPIFHINFGPETAKTFAVWLMHVYALDIGERFEDAINALLEPLEIAPFEFPRLIDWLSVHLYKNLKLSFAEGSSGRTCRSCGKSGTLYRTDCDNGSGQKIKENTRLCITCVVSIYLLDVTNNVPGAIFGSVIMLELLDLGSNIMRAYYYERGHGNPNDEAK